MQHLISDEDIQAISDGMCGEREFEVPLVRQVITQLQRRLHTAESLSCDLYELKKWLNEEPNREIDRAALARILHMADQILPGG